MRPQLLQEIETRALASQQQMGITKAQMTAKQRDIRMLQLTSKELSELPSETKVYEGVGKMYVSLSIHHSFPQIVLCCSLLELFMFYLFIYFSRFAYFSSHRC